MGDDGREGSCAPCKDAGGTRRWPNRRTTAVIFGMPQQAIRTGAVDAVLALGDIAMAIQTAGSANARGSSSLPTRGSE